MSMEERETVRTAALFLLSLRPCSRSGTGFPPAEKAVEAQIAELQRSLAVIDHKCRCCREAVAAGTEKHMFGRDQLPYAEEFRHMASQK